MKTSACLLSLLTLGLIVTSAPAFAGEPLIRAGSIGGSAGWTYLQESNDPAEITEETDDQSYGLLGLDGDISIPLASSISVQLDALGETYDTDEPSGERENLESLLLGGGHVSWRNPEKGLVGVFAGGSSGRTARAQNENHAYWGGVEGQAYLSDFTFYGQVAWAGGDVEDTEETFDNSYAVRGVARYFLADNKKIEVEASFTESNDVIDRIDDMDVYGWGAGYEFQLSDTPWNLHANYRGMRIDTTTEGETLNDHAFIVGVSYLFGARSLKHNDRYGATLDQPQIVGRAVNWIEPLD